MVVVAICAACSGFMEAEATKRATTTSTMAAFRMPDAGLSASFIPAGFEPTRTPLGKAIPGHVEGPGLGWTNDAQQFWSAATNQGFVIGVGRGRLASDLLATAAPVA